jgi:hypothetical protein
MNTPLSGMTGGECRARSIRLLALASLLAGCASLHWERPGTDEATTRNDTQECRAIARQQALTINRQPLFLPYFTQVRDNRGRIRTVPVAPFQQFGPPIWMADAPGLAIDRMTLKSDLYAGCLQAKGYRLVEDEPPASATPAAPTPASPPPDPAPPPE